MLAPFLLTKGKVMKILLACLVLIFAGSSTSYAQGTIQYVPVQTVVPVVNYVPVTSSVVVTNWVPVQVVTVSPVVQYFPTVVIQQPQRCWFHRNYQFYPVVGAIPAPVIRY
jgi:hypothetical protein